MLHSQAVINEDPNETMIKSLRAEIEELRRKLSSSGSTGTYWCTVSTLTADATDTAYIAESVEVL
jgi:hypothetical protein